MISVSPVSSPRFQSTGPRGARRHTVMKFCRNGTFQSTCPRGARLCSHTRVMSLGNFNPRAHEGHDAHVVYGRPRTGNSIHVPTRGTTWSDCNKHHTIIMSIHVPTRGTTSALREWCVKMPVFQSTCPRGARPRCTGKLYPCIHFNPRAHEGHDAKLYFGAHVDEFQSTCPRGARLNEETSISGRPDFNPRAHEGHDHRARDYLYYQRISIHVPTRGTTTTHTTQEGIW